MPMGTAIAGIGGRIYKIAAVSVELRIGSGRRLLTRRKVNGPPFSYWTVIVFTPRLVVSRLEFAAIAVTVWVPTASEAAGVANDQPLWSQLGLLK